MIDEVIIPAAGVGSRMAEITLDRPKCMAPFLGGTILSRLLRQLAVYAPRRIHIVGGHRADVLARYLATPEFDSLPINLLHNAEYASTNSFASVAVGLAEARGQVLMVNSDVVYDSEIIRRMVESAAPFAFAIDRQSYSEESEKLVTNSDGRVVQIAKTVVAADAAGCSLDLYRLNLHHGGDVWQTMIRAFAQRPFARKRLFEDFLDHALLAIPFACVETDGREWYEIDTEAELNDAENVFVSVDRQSGQL